MDNFSQSLIEKTTKVRKSGLTFAAEAGTQRLRDVINKNCLLYTSSLTATLSCSIRLPGLCCPRRTTTLPPRWKSTMCC